MKKAVIIGLVLIALSATALVYGLDQKSAADEAYEQWEQASAERKALFANASDKPSNAKIIRYKELQDTESTLLTEHSKLNEYWSSLLVIGGVGLAIGMGFFLYGGLKKRAS